MKRIVVIIFTFMMVSIGVVFAIQYMFHGDLFGGKGLFQGIGNVLDVTTNFKDNSIPQMEEVVPPKFTPLVRYVGGAQEVDSVLQFKSLFEVTTDEGTKNGSEEDGFSIFISAIKTKENVSVLEFYSAEQIENMEEIPAPFIYDKATDSLYLYKSGSYTVSLKVYDDNGSVAEYRFVLPVEVKQEGE